MLLPLLAVLVRISETLLILVCLDWMHVVQKDGYMLLNSQDLDFVSFIHLPYDESMIWILYDGLNSKFFSCIPLDQILLSIDVFFVSLYNFQNFIYPALRFPVEALYCL